MKNLASSQVVLKLSLYEPFQSSHNSHNQTPDQLQAPDYLKMYNNVNELIQILDELQRHETFTQVRQYNVELLQYWSRLLAYQFQCQSTESYFEILAGLTKLATQIGYAAGTEHVLEGNRERRRYIFLSEKMIEMVSFLTSCPDMVQLSDVLKMYALQVGRLRFLEDPLMEDDFADGIEAITAELCPQWRQNPEHWHCTVWTELQLGMH